MISLKKENGMKKWIAIGIIILGLISIIYVIWDQNRPGIRLDNIVVTDTIKVDNSAWYEYMSISIQDSMYAYEVIWDQKYGVTKKEYCKVIFKNDKNNLYKLVAPWRSSIEIPYANINNIAINKILIKSIPDFKLK